MYYTGFADEAGKDISTQIKAIRELGWSRMESRNIGDCNIHDIPDDQFDEVCLKLAEASVSINCFGSEVANWSQDVRKPEDVKKSRKQLQRAIPRMKKLGCTMIRGMSYTQIQDVRPDSDDIRDLVITHTSELVRLCEDEGLLFLHENCMNFGGLSPDHTLFLLDRIPSPSFKLVFDMGNPVNSWDYRDWPPIRKQESYEFYKAVREFIYYVHIKDCIYQKENGTLFPDTDHVWPGEGQGQVREIVSDLLRHGYEGGFSIEPHMGAVYHDPSIKTDDDARYQMFIEYGKKFMLMVDEIRGRG